MVTMARQRAVAKDVFFMLAIEVVKRKMEEEEKCNVRFYDNCF
jgi:hypothetical protein